MNWFAQFSRRHLLTGCLIVVVEIILYRQYASLGAEFHFWLHGLFGVTIGVCALTAWRLLRPRPSSLSPWEAGVLGHIISAVPDILFIAVGVLHVYWMDVFALHISVHFIPAPVVTMLILCLLSLLSYGLVADGYRRSAIGCLGVVAVLLSLSLTFRQPIPTDLKQLEQHSGHYALICPLALETD